MEEFGTESWAECVQASTEFALDLLVHGIGRLHPTPCGYLLGHS